MSTMSLEERVALIEMEVLRLKKQINKAPAEPWWEQISGVFADTPAFDQAVTYGHQYRKAQRPAAETLENDDVPA